MPERRRPHNPPDEIVDLIDPSDRVIGWATRREVRRRNLLHRGVGILCRNSRGDVYVHRRTLTKDVFPGMYDMFVGGVVARGEDYESAAAREIAEELGIVGPRPGWIFNYLYTGARNRSLVAVYEITWDGEIRHQEEEISWGTFMTPEELEERIAEWPFVPDGLEIYRNLSNLPGQSSAFRQSGNESGLGSPPAAGNGSGGLDPPRNR